MPDPRYYMGLDVGGTKTHCLIGDSDGHIYGFGAAGTGSYEYHGIEPAAAENRKAIEAALRDAGLDLDQISAAGLGVAGADLPEDFEMLEREIYTLLFQSKPRVFRNDSFAALRGGTRATYGIAIACGTDCVCAGRGPGGVETRVGGFGPEFGNECSGKLIGDRGLRAVWQAREGIIPPTLLTELFLERAGCPDVDAFFYEVYRGRMDTATLEPRAELVFEAAAQGDSHALAILRDGGNYLGLMVNAVARALDLGSTRFELVMAGSVFRARNSGLIAAMLETVSGVHPGVEPVMPRFEPVVGAMLLAMDTDTVLGETFYESLSEELRAIEMRHRVKLQARPEVDIIAEWT